MTTIETGLPTGAGTGDRLDITAETCPMTFVRTRLALDRLPAGAVLMVRLAGEVPWRNVVRNAASLGHSVISDDPEPGSEGIRWVAIRKA